MKGSRTLRPIASELFASGWLPPRAAADALGITLAQLHKRVKDGDIKSREIAPGTGIRLYEVTR